MFELIISESVDLVAYKLSEHIESVEGAVKVVHHKGSHVRERNSHLKRTSLCLLYIILVACEVSIFDFSHLGLFLHCVSSSKDQNTLIVRNISSEIYKWLVQDVYYLPPGRLISRIVALEINSLNCGDVGIARFHLSLRHSSSLAISTDRIDHRAK